MKFKNSAEFRTIPLLVHNGRKIFAALKWRRRLERRHVNNFPEGSAQGWLRRRRVRARVSIRAHCGRTIVTVSVAACDEGQQRDDKTKRDNILLY